MFLFVFLPLSRGILAELLSIILNNWQRKLSGKHLSNWNGAVGRGSSSSPQWCSDSASVYPTFAVGGTELPICLYSSQLPSCSEVGTAPGRQLNRLMGSAGKWYQLCGRASFETLLKIETTTKLQGQLLPFKGVRDREEASPYRQEEEVLEKTSHFTINLWKQDFLAQDWVCPFRHTGWASHETYLCFIK